MVTETVRVECCVTFSAAKTIFVPRLTNRFDLKDGIMNHRGRLTSKMEVTHLLSKVNPLRALRTKRSRCAPFARRSTGVRSGHIHRDFTTESRTISSSGSCLYQRIDPLLFQKRQCCRGSIVVLSVCQNRGAREGLRIVRRSAYTNKGPN